MVGELRSWRLMSILNSEIAAGNCVFRESYSGGAAVVVLEKAFMTPMRPGDGVLEYIEQTFDPSCFKMLYHDKETNEYLACRECRSPLKDIKSLFSKKKRK